MADTRLQALPDTPLPANRDSQLFIERDTGGAVFVSEKTTVAGLLNILYTIVSTPQVAVEGSAFAVDTTLGEVTITLPATPSVGDVVHIVDYAGTFLQNDCIMDRNGENIMGLNENMNINVSHVSVTFEYIDATQGWRMV